MWKRSKCGNGQNAKMWKRNNVTTQKMWNGQKAKKYCQNEEMWNGLNAKKN